MSFEPSSSDRDMAEHYSRGGLLAGFQSALAEIGLVMSLGLVMGPDVQTKVMNLVGAIGSRALAPVEIVCRKT